MRHIGRCVLLALIGWGLLPAHATAQVSYDEAVRGYYAMLQIQRDVWLDNPNQLEAARHALMIARDHGLIGGDPSAIDPSAWNEDGGTEWRCMWVEDENGEWQERCSEYQTLGCKSASQIRDMTNAKDMMNFLGWFYQGAAAVATGLANPPVATLFQGMSFFFQGAGLSIQYRLDRTERCS
jgi:hypothetical protein